MNLYLSQPFHLIRSFYISHTNAFNCFAMTHILPFRASLFFRMPFLLLLMYHLLCHICQEKLKSNFFFELSTLLNFCCTPLSISPSPPFLFIFLSAPSLHPNPFSFSFSISHPPSTPAYLPLNHSLSLLLSFLLLSLKTLCRVVTERKDMWQWACTTGYIIWHMIVVQPIATRGYSL